MNIKPLHDNVVVKPVSLEETTKSGIVLPDTIDREKQEQGEVVAINEEGSYIEAGHKVELKVKVGDKIIFKKYSPDEIKVDGEEYLIIPEKDILAILS